MDLSTRSESIDRNIRMPTRPALHQTHISSHEDCDKMRLTGYWLTGCEAAVGQAHTPATLGNKTALLQLLEVSQSAPPRHFQFMHERYIWSVCRPRIARVIASHAQMPRSFLVKTKQQQQQRCDVSERTSNDVTDDAGDVTASRRRSRPTALSNTLPQLHAGEYKCHVRL